MIELRREARGGVARVGHRGAPALAPENTLASFEAAVAHGCDMLEVDVVPLRDGTLVLAHSHSLRELSHGAARGRAGSRSLADLRRVAPNLPTLDDALRHTTDRFPDVVVQLDVKRPGHEEEVVAAIRRHDAVERVWVSSAWHAALRRFRQLEPRLLRSLTYPHDRTGVGAAPILLPAIRAGAAVLRRRLPARIDSLLDRSGASALTLYHLVCSRAAIDRAHARGAAVFAWTVDDSAAASRLVEAGVDGIITNDPRIFAAARMP